MNKIETEILIKASKDNVWKIFSDFDNYSKWNPFIKSIKGEVSKGRKIEVKLTPPDSNGMTFKPIVLAFDEGKEFRWKGKLWIKGLFDGEHYFKLEEVDEKATRFIHGEIFQGILVGMFRNILKKTEQGFINMNEALKNQCEEN